MTFTFAANLSMMFTEHPLLDRFDAAAQAGFAAVEILFPYEARPKVLRERLDASGLTLALINMPMGDAAAGDRGLACLPGRQAEFRDSVALALEYAHALDCDRLHCMAGLRPRGFPVSELQGRYLENLAYAAEICRPSARTVTIEPINRRDMPRYHLCATAAARAAIVTIGAENLKLQLDLYHCQVSEGDLAHRIRACADITGHVQIAGAPERHEPDVGEINYPYLFEILHDCGYDGYVGCEYRPRGPTAAGLGWFQAAQARHDAVARRPPVGPAHPPENSPGRTRAGRR